MDSAFSFQRLIYEDAYLLRLRCHEDVYKYAAVEERALPPPVFRNTSAPLVDFTQLQTHIRLFRFSREVDVHISVRV